MTTTLPISVLFEANPWADGAHSHKPSNAEIDTVEAIRFESIEDAQQAIRDRRHWAGKFTMWDDAGELIDAPLSPTVK